MTRIFKETHNSPDYNKLIHNIINTNINTKIYNTIYYKLISPLVNKMRNIFKLFKSVSVAVQWA